VKRARQCLFPLRRLKSFGMSPQVLKTLYNCTIENILTDCITAWYGNCSASDHKALQRVVRTAQYTTGDELPAIQDLYTGQCQKALKKKKKTVKDSSHANDFSLLPQGKSGTNRTLNSFYLQVTRLLNS
jgi:hypothetical protein